MRVPLLRRISRSNDSGQALVEFALVLPLLLVLILGIVSYGLYINANVSLQQAARIGARMASLGNPLGCPGDSAQTQIGQGQEATIYGAVDDQINQSAVLKTGTGTSAASVLQPLPTIVTSNGDSLVTVNVSMTYKPLIPFPGLLPSTVQLKQSYTMMVETAPNGGSLANGSITYPAASCPS